MNVDYLKAEISLQRLLQRAENRINYMREQGREIVTIRKTERGRWYKKFDDRQTGFKRISEREAIESIQAARGRGEMFYDTDREFGFWE